MQLEFSLFSTYMVAYYNKYIKLRKNSVRATEKKVVKLQHITLTEKK